MIPDRTKAQWFSAGIDLATVPVKVLLLKDTTAYTPDSAAHEFVGDVLAAGAEFDGTNYARQSVTGQVVNEDNVDSEAEWDADDVTFPSLGASSGGQVIQTIVVYQQVGGDDTTPADDPVLRVIDDSETAELPVQTNGGDFTISWAAEGIINLN
jgi:hypothetical protein